ncbi:TetR/AcrR family transcriptional regulator [Streptomyces sp. NPDC087844]|uniref:TetR/AcrR family transcriptional regulator n=1 Tax=Streptomyces sp. NPDC087844 TaxID=3365805 RepID=UPI0037F78FE3
MANSGRSRRSEPSRRNLIEATGQLVTERGVEGLRVREIASVAGMSPAAVLYHYPDNSELVLAVHRNAVDRYMAGRIASQENLEDPREQLTSMMVAGVPPYADEDLIRLLYEMHGLARRSPGHAQLMTDLWGQERQLYADILRAGSELGHFQIEDPFESVAAILLALEDGLVLHLVSGNSDLDAEKVIQAFRRSAARELACPELRGAPNQHISVQRPV